MASVYCYSPPCRVLATAQRWACDGVNYFFLRKSSRALVVWNSLQDGKITGKEFFTSIDFLKKIKSGRAKLLCLDFLFLFHLRKKKNNFLTIGTFFLSWRRKNQRSQGFINFWRNHSCSQAESLNSFAEGANSNSKASSHKPNKKATFIS